jgi:dTDP-glucose 4,6-dehydratase
MQNILVTGSAGFIGSNFVRFALQADAHVQLVSLDALTYAGSQENLARLPGAASRHVFYCGDICDRALVDEILARHEIDTLVHFAAESHVDRSIQAPGTFIQTNILGTFSLLEAVRDYWLVRNSLPGRSLRFHHISTDEVYGALGPDDPAWTENSPYAPNSPYAASKAASDHLVRSFGRTYSLPFSLTNCSNNYGPHQFPEKLIPLTILNALAGKPVPIYGDGQQVRDWLFVEDHCEAIWLVLGHGSAGESYNIGAGNQPTNLTLVTQLCALLDQLVPDSPHHPHAGLITHVPDRPGHDRRYAMDASRIQTRLGWSPRHSLEQGLLATVRWYLEHQDWVAVIRSRPEYQAWMDGQYRPRGGKP